MSHSDSTPSTDWPEGFADPAGFAAPFTIAQAVAWGEMDSLGHVNNTVYLRWFENVRFAYFERIGLNALHRQAGQGPILARTTCDFRAPVTFPDEVLISTECTRLGTKSFTLYNRVWSTTQKTLVAEGEAIIVLMQYGADAEPRSIAIPQLIRTAIESLDAKALGLAG